MGSMGATWQDLAQTCVLRQQESIPKQWLLSSHEVPKASQDDVRDIPRSCGILTERELFLTEQDAAGLLARYQSRDATVREVTIAFLKRATIGQQLLNFATEILAEEALATADELDAYFTQTGQLYGPLHGIPTSVKEHIEMKGRVTHAGFVSKTTHIATDDALVVKQLKNAGAIIHMRTNQPQSLMHLDCNNNITGQTLNPLHRQLSPGGSSGGDGSAVGFHATILGVGTDIGGSVRIPAAFNNCYALRPTALRNSNLGLFGINAGQESIRGVVGPMCQSLSDIEIFQRTLLGQRPWEVDTTLVPLPWRQPTPPATLTVGLLMDDGLVAPHPPVRRALETTAAKLRAAGIRVVPFAPHDHARAWAIVSALYFPDGGARYRAEFDKTGEPELPLTTHAINFARKHPLSVADNWDLNAMREAYRREYTALMRERGVDVVLCPAYPGAGVKQGGAKYWGYTSVWNILDFPGLVMPSGLSCDKHVDLKDLDYEPRSEEDRAEQEAYDPELFHTVPVALQIVGKRWEDERVVDAANVIEKTMKNVKA